jgi:hypothetical protein
MAALSDSNIIDASQSVACHSVPPTSHICFGVRMWLERELIFWLHHTALSTTSARPHLHLIYCMETYIRGDSSNMNVAALHCTRSQIYATYRGAVLCFDMIILAGLPWLVCCVLQYRNHSWHHKINYST